MAKVTVYIPDDLLERARAVDETANTSQLVQRGLERLVGADRTHERRPADADALLAHARDKLAPAAAADFDSGYRAALTAADDRFWPLVNLLAAEGFDLRRWARRWRTAAGAGAISHGFSPPSWFSPLATDLGTIIDPIGFDHLSFTPTGAFVGGYERALADAWDAVEHPWSEASPEPKDP